LLVKAGVRQFAAPGAPAWSPDGRMLAYSRGFRSRHHRGIFVVRADGSDRRRLTDGKDLAPSFSPTGRRILFSRLSDDGLALMSIRVDGSHPRRLQPPWTVADPGLYSPNGRWIAYGSTRFGGDGDRSRIFLMRPNGSHNHPITTASEDIGPVDWSPDSAHLTYAGPGRNGFMDRNGSNEQPLGLGFGLTYSPNGQFFAFSAPTDTSAVLETARTNGTDPRQLTDPSDGAAGDPAWQPLP
jgi:TolB protein